MDVQEPIESPPERIGFIADFKRFFMRGLSALLPTLITFWLLVKVWGFLYETVGRPILWLGSKVLEGGRITIPRGDEIDLYLRSLDWPEWAKQALGVALAMVLVYIVGLLIGNLIGRTMWRLAERAVSRIPIIRAVYPAVKQITDYLLADRSTQFAGSRVVAVQPHAEGIWSIGLVTGPGLPPLSRATGHEMVTVFIPSSPTAFSGYVVVVPRSGVVELPLKVEEAMRLLISGGVIQPGKQLTIDPPLPLRQPEAPSV